MRVGEIGGVVVGEVGDGPLLQQEPGLVDVGDREALRGHLQPQQLREAAVRCGGDDRSRGGAGAGRGADEAHDLEDAERLADARPTDTEGGGELTFGLQAIAGAERALEKVGFDLLEDHTPGAGGSGVGHRHPSKGLTTLSPVV